MGARELWSRILVIVGNIAMLAGAVDPIEGSLVILPGSGLVALGSFLGHNERRLVIYRVWVCILIAIGVGAPWGLSAVGGFGGGSGHSKWLGLLMTLPYLIGWSMGIWGPGSPRWLLLLGIAVGLWYESLVAMTLLSNRHGPPNEMDAVLGAIGVLTIVGCVSRFRTRRWL